MCIIDTPPQGDTEKWEHFIPRVYYKGFSNIIKKRAKERLLVWADMLPLG